MIMADISTEIDVWRSALIGWMLLRGAVLPVFGGTAYPSRQSTRVATLPLTQHILITKNKQGLYIAGN
jgi:hypothetical protein